MSQSQLRSYLLGPFRVMRDDKSVIGFEADKMRALLAYLIVEADRPHHRDVLAALLWPDQPDTAARQSLRQALYIVRQVVDEGSDHTPPTLLATRLAVQFNPARDTWCDVWDFRNLLAACKAHVHPKSGHSDRCTECIQRLRQATELYRGDFLEGFVVNDRREFEEWMLLERETHHRQMMQALGQLANYYEDVGEHEQSLHYALWQLKLEPWREEAHRQAMRLLSRTGQRSAALAQYEMARQVLLEELGIEPSRETTSLYERIRDAETEQQPEHPVALMGGKSLLPINATPLIGREAEVTAVVERLLRDEVRLLTLTGPGGVGKTRIALQAAADLADLQEQFTDGAYFVNLAPITDPGLVTSEIASALAVKEMPDKTPMESITSYLQGKKVLLVLDNFEQVAEAAPLIAQLIQSAPGIKALVTSRMALRLRGSHEFPVLPMSLPEREHPPPIERLAGYEGIRLFVERAGAIKPGFSLTKDNAAAIVEICHRLDGLPLAIELAAARIKVLPPQAMLTRLQSRLELIASKDRDVPTRQQTLRNTIEWSYNLLDEAEKILFRRLAVFQGGRTLGAIEAVCSGTYDAPSDRTSSAPSAAPIVHRPEIDTLNGVESLISKSLLRQREGSHDDEPRFWMLETIHEYARGKLRESGEEEEIRRRHARYFMALAEEAAPHLKREDQARWLERVDDENDNVRAAFRWARTLGEAGNVEATETGLRLAIALERFWQVRVHVREGFEQTMGLLAIGQLDGAIRARALNVAAGLAEVRGDYLTEHSLLEESLCIWRELGDKKNLVETLNILANVFHYQEDYARARALTEEALSMQEELGDRKTSVHNLAVISYEQGDYISAGSLLEEALALESEAGDTRRVALALTNLGLVAYQLGDYELALSRLKESLAIRQALGAKLGIVYTLEAMAMVYGGLGKIEMAAQLWGVTQTLRDAIGAPLPPNDRTHYKRALEIVRAQFGQEAFDLACDEGRAMSMEQAIRYALDSNVSESPLSSPT